MKQVLFINDNIMLRVKNNSSYYYYYYLIKGKSFVEQ